ncbi:DapH/DapD/GlmU-related protein [Erythrobacter sp. SCSIO 43205]|uniref:DapH/DapD/GlmU-related protein n=1 Tax=Erythrobacter sp. SCSIO 43205 TaxID=2779361 RepID=UPI00210664F8|nr:DapH/DapD/GlmU-related protein [Erythrobacter sp. SCSIO 43205]
MWGGGGVTIGNRVFIASHVALTLLTHDADADDLASTSIGRTIVIGDNVWIRAGAKILPGVRLGEGRIIGAGAVVTADVASRTVVTGVPC